MSFKFERDTYKQTEGGAAGVAGAAASAVADARDQLLGRDGPIPGTSGKHPFREAIGTAITGGKQNAGTKGYLAVRLLPLLTLWHQVSVARYQERMLLIGGSSLLTSHFWRRHTSSSSKKTLCGPRCSRLAPCQEHKNSSHHSSPRIAIRMGITSRHACPRWPHTVPLSAPLSVRC